MRHSLFKTIVLGNTSTNTVIIIIETENKILFYPVRGRQYFFFRIFPYY
jgi:hypothetical protein